MDYGCAGKKFGMVKEFERIISMNNEELLCQKIITNVLIELG